MSFDLKIANGDLQIGANGDLQQVTDTDKLTQDVIKIVITPLGGNPWFPWYGCPVTGALVGNVLSFTFTSALATSQLNDALQTLQSWQNAQANSGQTVTPAELLAAVQQASVVRSQSDPRYFNIVVKILSKSLQSTTTGFSVGI